MADIIGEAGRTGKGLKEIAAKLSVTGVVRKAEVESLTILSTELGFLRELRGLFSMTRQGAAFERFVIELDSRPEQWSRPPLEQTIEMTVCATVPPGWFRTLSANFGDKMLATRLGPKMVVEEATNRVVVVSPFIDVQVLQMCLEHVYAKNVEFIVVTSEPRLARSYESGHNYEREKLGKLIQSRFRSGKVFFLESGQSIAHAKVWSGERSVFVTSANMKSDSLTDNFELGIFTDEPEIVSTIKGILDRILRMEELACILEVQ